MLGARYVMYGEWLYAKHTVYYDMLPHYFMEFDIYDKENGSFLGTAARRRHVTVRTAHLPGHKSRPGRWHN